MPFAGSAAWLIYKRMQLRLVRRVGDDKDGIDAAIEPLKPEAPPRESPEKAAAPWRS